jgi:hypothetical protein
MVRITNGSEFTNYEFAIRKFAGFRYSYHMYNFSKLIQHWYNLKMESDWEVSE